MICPFSWQQPTLLASWRPFDKFSRLNDGNGNHVWSSDQWINVAHTHTHLLSHPLRHIFEDLSVYVCRCRSLWIIYRWDRFIVYFMMWTILKLSKAPKRGLFHSKPWSWGSKVYSSNVDKPLCQFWLALLEEINSVYYCITSHHLHRFTEMYVTCTIASTPRDIIWYYVLCHRNLFLLVNLMAIYGEGSRRSIMVHLWQNSPTTSNFQWSRFSGLVGQQAFLLRDALIPCQFPLGHD